MGWASTRSSTSLERTHRRGNLNCHRSRVNHWRLFVVDRTRQRKTFTCRRAVADVPTEGRASVALRCRCGQRRLLRRPVALVPSPEASGLTPGHPSDQEGRRRSLRFAEERVSSSIRPVFRKYLEGCGLLRRESSPDPASTPGRPPSSPSRSGSPSSSARTGGRLRLSRSRRQQSLLGRWASEVPSRPRSTHEPPVRQVPPSSDGDSVGPDRQVSMASALLVRADARTCRESRGAETALRTVGTRHQFDLGRFSAARQTFLLVQDNAFAAVGEATSSCF